MIQSFVSLLLFVLPQVAWADLNTAAIFLIGFIGQHAKAYKQIPTWIIQAVELGIGFAFYMYGHPDLTVTNWFVDGLVYACGIPGISSIAAGSKMAPATDSIGRS